MASGVLFVEWIDESVSANRWRLSRKSVRAHMEETFNQNQWEIRAGLPGLAGLANKVFYMKMRCLNGMVALLA